MRCTDPSPEELYRWVKSAHWSLYSRLDPHIVDDMVHDVYLIAAGAAMAGKIRRPGALRSFIRGCVKNKERMAIRRLVNERSRFVCVLEVEGVDGKKQSPFHDAECSERRRIAASISTRLHPLRSQLINLILAGGADDEVMRQMGLTTRQYQILKSRAIGDMRRLVG